MKWACRFFRPDVAILIKWDTTDCIANGDLNWKDIFLLWTHLQKNPLSSRNKKIRVSKGACLGPLLPLSFHRRLWSFVCHNPDYATTLPLILMSWPGLQVRGQSICDYDYLCFPLFHVCSANGAVYCVPTSFDFFVGIIMSQEMCSWSMRMEFVQSLDMKTLLAILETFDSQVDNVDANANRWIDELKRMQPFVLQLLDNVATSRDGTNRAASVNVERCWLVWSADSTFRMSAYYRPELRSSYFHNEQESTFALSLELHVPVNTEYQISTSNSLRRIYIFLINLGVVMNFQITSFLFFSVLETMELTEPSLSSWPLQFRMFKVLPDNWQCMWLERCWPLKHSLYLWNGVLS